MNANDPVNHPKHYTTHPSKVECITVTEHMNFCLGNAMKYLFRNKVKHDTPILDLEKARWYINRHVENLAPKTKLRSQRKRRGSLCLNRKNKEACKNKEWIHDVNVLVSTTAFLRSFNCSGDFRWTASRWLHGFPFERKKRGQPALQSCLGDPLPKYETEMGTWNVLSWRKKSDGEIKRQRCCNDKKRRGAIYVSSKNSKEIQSWEGNCLPHSLRDFLAISKYVIAEPTSCAVKSFFYVWRAGFGLDELNDLKKARWYLDREIARLTKTK